MPCYTSYVYTPERPQLLGQPTALRDLKEMDPALVAQTQRLFP